MAWDCRIGCRLNLFNVIILKVLLAQIYLVGFYSISNLSIVQSAFVDCDEVHHCICFKPDGDDYYQIECPNKQLNTYPVTAKVYPRIDRDRSEHGSLSLTCDYAKPDFDWRLIRGLNLGKENQGFVIKKITIQYCPIPPVNDSIAELLRHLNINPKDIISFGFTSYRDLTNFPDYMLSPMTNLIDLNLGNNRLETVPNLSFFPNLNQINLHSNNIRTISQDTFAHNKELKNLQITTNNLTHIEDESLPDSLVFLNLVTNQISRLTNETFSNLKDLQILYLNVNPLNDVDPHAFSALTQLHTLRVDSSSLSHFPVLRNLNLLENISISHSRSFETNCRRLSSILNETGGQLTTTAASTVGNLNEEVMTTTVASDVVEITTGAGSTEMVSNGRRTLRTLSSSPFSTNTNESNSPSSSSAAAQSEPLFECVIENLPSLSNIYLIFDGLQEIPIFQNLPNLTSINLSRNKIQKLPLSAFAKVKSLKRLDLSGNEIFLISGIQTYQLVELDLSRNRIDQLDKSIFSYMGNLKKLNLSRNKIQYIDPKAFSSLTMLEDLDISNNLIDFSAPPPLGKENVFDIFTKGYSPFRSCTAIKRINLSYNQISTMPNDFYTTLLSLTTLNLSYNKFMVLRAADIKFIQNEIVVDLSNNMIALVDMKYWYVFFEKGTVNKITVQLNHNPLNCDCNLLEFKSYNFHVPTFEIDELRCEGPTSPKNLSGLKLLQVDKDDLVCALEEKEGCPSECECWRRTSDMTILINCAGRNNGTEMKLPNVTAIKIKGDSDTRSYEFLLDLSNNGITDISDGYAKDLPTRLRGVNLRGNKLESLAFLKAVGDNNVTRFNLSDNPFPCNDCNFLTYSRSQFPRIWDNENLSCIIHDSSIVEWKKALEFDYEHICSNKTVISIFVPLLSIILLLFVAAAYIYFRHGWAIRAFLYSKGFGRFLCDNKLEDDEEKIYDAFVSYSHQDETWVLEELVNRLEEQEGFKLCLHFRDWIPGDWIPDQIVRSVDQSRRTVVILSKHFVESCWSRLEFKAAHSQALSERSNRLILVLMDEDLTDKDVQDDDLRVYMKMNTYIKSSDPWFWHKLKYALPHRKCVVEENQNQYTKKVQRERAIKLDKLRTQMESQIQVSA